MRSKRAKELKRLAGVVGREQSQTTTGKEFTAKFGLDKLIEVCRKEIFKRYQKTPKPLRHSLFKKTKGLHLNPALQ